MFVLRNLINSSWQPQRAAIVHDVQHSQALTDAFELPASSVATCYASHSASSLRQPAEFPRLCAESERHRARLSRSLSRAPCKAIKSLAPKAISEFEVDTRRGLHSRCSNSRTWLLLGKLSIKRERSGHINFQPAFLAIEKLMGLGGLEELDISHINRKSRLSRLRRWL